MARLPIRSVLRFAALGVLVLGAWDLLPGEIGLVADLRYVVSDREWMSFLLLPLSWGFETPLLVCLAGGALYVLAGLSRPHGRRQPGTRLPRFDFSAVFAPYLIYEPFAKRMLRLLNGVMLLAGAGALTMLLFAVAHDLPFMFLSEKRQPLPEVVILGVVLQVLSVVPIGLVGYACVRRFARGAERSLRGDRRRPFLYLRSFEADEGQLGDEVGFVGKVWRVLGGTRYAGYEERLVRAVADVAPVVAIGKPGEKLPPLGAARIYVREDWQRVVAELVASARAVFLRIGHTQGFWWEIRYLATNCDPRKVIICLPWHRRQEIYARFRRRGADLFPHPLPVSVGDAMFLTFDAEWNPRLLPLAVEDRFQGTAYYGAMLSRRPPSPFRLLQSFVARRTARGMRRALNDALVKLGIPRRPLPLTAGELFVLVLVLLVIRYLMLR